MAINPSADVIRFGHSEFLLWASVLSVIGLKLLDRNRESSPETNSRAKCSIKISLCLSQINIHIQRGWWREGEREHKKKPHFYHDDKYDFHMNILLECCLKGDNGILFEVMVIEEGRVDLSPFEIECKWHDCWCVCICFGVLNREGLESALNFTDID